MQKVNWREKRLILKKPVEKNWEEKRNRKRKGHINIKERAK